MKRLICFVVSLALIISAVPLGVFAEVEDGEIGHVHYCEDFNHKYKTTISYWGLGDTDLLTYSEPSKTGNSIDLQCFYGQKKAVFNKRDAANMNAWVYLPAINNYTSSDQFMFQFEMRNEGEAIKTFDLYTKNYQDTTLARINLFTIDETGYVCVNNEPLIYIPKRQFSEVALLLDCKENTKTLYVNGKQVATRPYNEKMHIAKHPDWKNFYGPILDITVSGGLGKLYMSYALAYDASTHFTKAQVEKRYAEIQERISIYPSKEEIAEALKGYTVFALEGQYAYYDNDRREIPNKVYSDFYQLDEAIMIPVRYSAEALGAEVLYSEEKTDVKFNGKTISIKEGSDILTVDGEEKKMPYAAHIKDGALYVPYELFLKEFGTVFCDGDVIAIGENFEENINKAFPNVGNINKSSMQEVYLYLNFYMPEPEEIAKAYEESPNYGQHPRLDWTKELVEEKKRDMEIDERLKGWIDARITEADALINEEPHLPYFVNNYNLTTNMPTAIKLAFAYMMTDDEKYAEAAWKLLDLFCDYPGIQYTRTYMETAIIAFQACQAYDMLGDWPTQEMRENLWEAMKRLAFLPHIRAGNGVGAFSQIDMNVVYQNHNIFHNGAIFAMASMFYEYDPELCSKAMAQAFRNYEYFRTIRKPDGGDPEGPHYWDYGIRQEVYFAERTNNILGTDFGYTSNFGMDKTVEHYLSCIGSSGILYNYADCKPSEPLSALPYYFAKRYNNSIIANEILYHLDGITRSDDYVDLIRWYSTELNNSQSSNALPLDSYYRGVEQGAMRTKWQDNSASYIGYKGSVFDVQAHQHYDCGSFVFDALGERWAMDPGFENQLYPYVFDTNYDNPQLGKEQYYMLRAEGHNTLLINPRGRRYDQPIYPEVRRSSYDSKDGGAYSVLDTTCLYFDEAENAKRGFMLTDYRQTAVIRDELKLKNNENDIWWFMHTEADVEFLNGGKQAVLTKNGKQVLATLECSVPSAKFTVMPAEAFPESPKPSPSYLTDLSHIQKLAVNVKADAGDFSIAVSLKPIKTTLNEAIEESKSYGTIAKWRLEEEAPFECSGLEELLVDGQQIQGFEPKKAVYALQYESVEDDIPVISAKAQDGLKVEVIQAEKMPGAAAIKVYDDANPENFFSVQIGLTVPALWNGFPQSAEELEIVSCEASQEPNGTKVENLLDGDPATILAVQKEADVVYDLGEIKDLDGVGVYFTYARRCWFKVEISDDKKNWRTLFDGETDGTITGYNTVMCSGKKGRYVKVSFNGTVEGEWNSISEIRVIKKQ